MPDGPAAADDTSPSAESWAVESTKHRKLRLKLVCNSPLAQLVMIRTTMEPLRAYLLGQFQIASDDWLVKARCDGAKSAAGGAGAAPMKYLIVETINGTVPDIFPLQLHLLLTTPQLWEAMPPASHTFECRALAFRLASRMACAFHKLIVSRDKDMPYHIFMLLADLSRAPRVSSMAEVQDGYMDKGFHREVSDLAGGRCSPNIRTHGDIAPC